MPDQNQQRIPRSLGLLLRVMRLRKGLTQAALARKLNHLPRRFKGDVTARVLARGEHSLRLYYFALRLYAKWSHIPAGMIYIIAACGAHLRDGKIGRVHDTARWLREFADLLNGHAGRLSRLEAPDLRSTVIDEPGTPERLARDAVLDYLREVETETGEIMPYAGSDTQSRDAKLAMILYEIIEHLPKAIREDAKLDFEN